MSEVRKIRTTRRPYVLITFYFDEAKHFKCAHPNLYLHTANMNVVMKAIDTAVFELSETYVWYVADIDYDEAMFEYCIEVTVFDPLTNCVSKD